jgi:Mn2+/Fe2+ NRAMP family transporter
MTSPTSAPVGRRSWHPLALFGPGLLIAATGVGAGDLLTASLAGARHGLTLLWAAWLGALLKWFLNEGIARWQMATDSTLLEGWTRRLGQAVRWAFLIYLLPWAYFTGGALITACGVAGTGVFPIGSPQTSKVVWGVLHSLIGLVIVWRGGFRMFVRFMAACTVIMVAAVLLTAVLIHPDWGAVFHGLFVPRLPQGGTAYTLGVLGGVGGTVTLLSYGYWIRESGRAGTEGVRTCRIDLAAGYTLTGLFGVAMIIIGSRVTLQRGPTAALELASQLQLALGPTGKWIFLAGFWGAVFSSLLGVWQSVPYIFADFTTLPKRTPGGLPDLKATPAYRWFLIAIATVPLLQLGITVERAQLLYAVMGALFMPFLALTLLILNTRRRWVGERFVSGWITNAALAATFVLFTYVGAGEIRNALARLVR